MRVRDLVGQSLALLPSRKRRTLTMVTVAQMATSLMDLVGVLLVGAVTALSLAAVSGEAMPNLVTSFLEVAKLSEAPLLHAAAILAVVAGLLLIGKSVINAILIRRILQFLAHRQAEVSGGMTRALLSRSLIEVQRHSSQETAYALTTGVNFATLVILGQAVVLMSEAALLVVLAVGLLLISPLVTVFTAGFFTVVALILQRMLSGQTQRLGRKASSFEVKSVEAIQASVRGFRELLVTDRREEFAGRIERFRWEVASVQAGLQYMALAPKFVFEVALVIGAALLVSSQLLTNDLAAAVGVIAVFLAAGSRVVPSMLRMQGAALAIRGAGGHAEPTYELAMELAYSPDDVQTVTDSAARAPRARSTIHPLEVGSVEVADVNFSYPGSTKRALKDINLRIEAGASLALVGRTGCGKSTLADVILGVVNPDSGSVLIGGLAPAQTVRKWPGALGYVPQAVTIVKGSVLENVAFGLPRDQVDADRVWEVLRQAQLAEFLHSQREGLKTELAEDSIRLSGGQRQRLGLARALYSRPSVLVLDEATSALDTETEAAMGRAVAELEGSVTLVVIAHRLSTIRGCRTVAYMDEGRLVAQGSFGDVISQSPAFARQVELSGL